MSKTNKDFWNGPLTGSRIKSEDVKLPEMLIGYFIGPFGALLASGIFTSILQNYFTDVLKLNLTFLTTLQLFSTILIARCRVMKTLLPEATIICADGTKPDVLREEGLPEADALVTLTESDETNLIISSFAYHEQVPKIVTKVDEDNFIELAESYGLTTIIQPADVTAGRIVEYVRWMQNSAHSSGVETLRMVADGQAEALEFIVRAESQFLDVPLKALKLKDSVLVASIIRRGKCRVPSGNDAIELGDRVVVVTTNHGMHELKDILK